MKAGGAGHRNASHGAKVEYLESQRPERFILPLSVLFRGIG